MPVYWLVMAAIVLRVSGRRRVRGWYGPSHGSRAWVVVAAVVAVSAFPLLLVPNAGLLLRLPLLAVTWVGFALVNGTIEEVFWRGFLLTEITSWPRGLAEAYSGALFVAIHFVMLGAFAPALFNVPFLVILVVITAILTMLFVRTGSLRLGTAAHILTRPREHEHLRVHGPHDRVLSGAGTRAAAQLHGRVPHGTLTAPTLAIPFFLVPTGRRQSGMTRSWPSIRSGSAHHIARTRRMQMVTTSEVAEAPGRQLPGSSMASAVNSEFLLDRVDRLEAELRPAFPDPKSQQGFWNRVDVAARGLPYARSTPAKSPTPLIGCSVRGRSSRRLSSAAPVLPVVGGLPAPP